MASNIMIIDDSLIDRTIIKQILQKRFPDINIFEAEDGVNLNEKLITEAENGWKHVQIPLSEFTLK